MENCVIIEIEFSAVALKLNYIGGKIIIAHSKLLKGSISGALEIGFAKCTFQTIDGVFSGGKPNCAVLLVVRANLVQGCAFEGASYVGSFLFLCVDEPSFKSLRQS